MSIDVYETVLVASTDIFLFIGIRSTKKMSRRIKDFGELH